MANYPPLPGYVRYSPIVHFTPHVVGASSDPNYRGVSAPRFLFDLQARVAQMPPLDLPKRIEQYTAEEVKAFTRYYAELLVVDLQGAVRLTTKFFGSYNPNGGPPWKITQRGGSIQLMFFDPESDVWIEQKSFPDAGVSVSYYVQVYFE